MNKVILNTSEVQELVFANKYKVVEGTKFISRCIDGRYQADHNLPALAIAGADAGEMAVIFATANIYGFEVDNEKVFETLCKVVGGIKNLRFHTDEHAEAEVLMGGCGHIKNISQTPDDFKVTPAQVAFIKKKAKEAVGKGAVQEVLKGDHMEGAVLVITGPYGIFPQYVLKTSDGNITTQVFEFHKGLVDARHKVLVKELVKNKAVKLYEGCDEDYLYQVLSSTTEDHLMEIGGRLAKGLTIYSVAFEENGEFTLEESDKIQ